jgi:hypothetical protein
LNKKDSTYLIILPDCVIKHFNDPKHFQAELYAYQAGLRMLPDLLDFQVPQWIKIEKVKGIPYLDRLDYFYPELLAETYANFHLATLKNDKCLCHVDNSPKNILFCQGKYYFIDFADSRFEYPERDITHLLLFWAADFPADYFKYALETFLNGYLSFVILNSERWNSYLKSNIILFDQRRKLHSKKTGKESPSIQNLNRELLAQMKLCYMKE